MDKKNLILSNYFVLLISFFMLWSCSNEPLEDDNNNSGQKDDETSIVYDETGCLYTSYKGLVMVGYQGWFNADGDGANRKWTHYCASNGKFEPGYCTIDYWPDMTEYDKKYQTTFDYEDNSHAYVFSSYDYSTVDLHFKWMKDYGLDGIFLQRFLTTTKTADGKNHVDKVFENVIKASEKYERAFCLMYDITGTKPEELPNLISDWESIVEKYDLFNNEKHPTYLRHNGKPLLAIWGVGFNDDKRVYTVKQVYDVINTLRGENNRISIMLGVPYFWRELRRDTKNDPLLHTLIKDVDIIMDWGVGRYTYETYDNVAINDKNLKLDIEWCKNNNVLFVPHTYPGGSVGNIRNDITKYNHNPRVKGQFFWKQVSTAIKCGAEALYIGMFDEIDEGTQIFKCMSNSNVPKNKPEEGKKFVGYDDDLPSDYYLWLAGQATNWIHGDGDYNDNIPNRN